MTDRFVASARAVAALNGLPQYPFVVIDHPIANDGDDALPAVEYVCQLALHGQGNLGDAVDLERFAAHPVIGWNAQPCGGARYPSVV